MICAIFSSRQYRGFFLVELILAVAIASLGLTASILLLAHASAYTHSANQLNNTLNQMLAKLETNQECEFSYAMVAGVSLKLATTHGTWRTPSSKQASITLSLGV